MADSQDNDSSRTAAEYDAMADRYDAHNASSGANAYHERPATIRLLGDVAGLRVLEAGCGSGPLTEWLVAHGADVTAFDVSPGMVELVRTRMGNRARIHVADLARPLAFVPDSSVDLVVASLVLHYIRDWQGPLGEFYRVLRPSGSVVFSTHHPAWDWRNHCPDDYFAKLQVSEVWLPPHPVTFWRRPLTEITSAIREAGFVVETLLEARPLPELQSLDPSGYRVLTTGPFLLHFRLRPLQPDGSVVAPLRPFAEDE